MNWIYVELDTPRSDCAGCFIFLLAKKIVHFTKIHFFLKKKWKKFGSIKKKQYLCTVKQKQTTIQKQLQL